MSATLTIPIDLDSLPAKTRSWIIAKSAKLGIDPKKLIDGIIIDSAAKDGFTAKPQPQQKGGR